MAMMMQNGFALGFEFQKKVDQAQCLLARIFSALIVASPNGVVHVAAEAEIGQVSSLVGELQRAMESIDGYCVSAEAQLKGETFKGALASFQELFRGAWSPLRDLCKAIFKRVREDLMDGIAEQRKVKPPAKWKEHFRERPTPGGVQDIINQREIVIAVARSTLALEMLQQKLEEAGGKLPDADAALEDELDEKRMYTCLYSVWSLMCTKDRSPRSRQQAVTAKRAKVTSELKKQDLPGNISAMMDQWKKTGDAFTEPKD